MAHPATARGRSVRGERLCTTWKRRAGSAVPWLRHSGRARPPFPPPDFSSQPKERLASIRLPVRGVDELRFEARRGRMHADELAVAILQNVVTDDLFAAVDR